MLAKFYQKIVITLTIGSFLFSCAPQYTASFQQKSHESTRYNVEDVKQEEPVRLTSSEQEILKTEVQIKEVVIEPSKVEKLVTDPGNEVIRPRSNAELIQTLKNNPNATIAFDLDRKERKALKREVKEQFKEQKESTVMMQANNTESKILYYILAILLPPLAVGLWRGIGSDFWINLLLTLLLWLPGVIHAIIVISSKPKMSGRTTY